MSDKYSAEVGKGKYTSYIFQLNPFDKKRKKEYIKPYQKDKILSIPGLSYNMG